MGIKVNPSVWNAVFAVPTAIADEHLRRASGQQLKVLLYVLRYNGEDPETAAVAAGTGLTEADAADAMQYWIETGFLFKDGTPAPVQPTAAQQAPAEVRELPDVPDNVLPTYEQVAARTLESPEIRGLFNEAQTRLGKTIGYDTQSKLIMMMDTYGLPAEVILTIIEYAVSHGKTSISYMVKIGKNWAEQGIDTLEKAEEKLQVLADNEKTWKEFTSHFSMNPPPYTKARETLLLKWRNDYKQSYELIVYAYEQMINNINKVQFKYMDKILEDWHARGLTKPQEVLQSKKDFTAGNKPAGAKPAQRTSYDSDQYRQKARGPIQYQRRNNNGEQS